MLRLNTKCTVDCVVGCSLTFTNHYSALPACLSSFPFTLFAKKLSNFSVLCHIKSTKHFGAFFALALNKFHFMFYHVCDCARLHKTKVGMLIEKERTNKREKASIVATMCVCVCARAESLLFSISK